MSKVVEVTPEELDRWLAGGDAVLVDVRENFEHAAEHIEGAEHVPLATLEPETLKHRHQATRVVFQCRTGGRSAKAAGRFDGDPSYHLAGGIEAWKDSGRLTVKAPGGPPIDVMRQVQITAGSLILIGVVLSVLVSTWFVALSAFVGAGLIFAGASGWCGMAKLLSAMPWNRPRAA